MGGDTTPKSPPVITPLAATVITDRNLLLYNIIQVGTYYYIIRYILLLYIILHFIIAVFENDIHFFLSDENRQTHILRGHNTRYKRITTTYN